MNENQRELSCRQSLKSLPAAAWLGQFFKITVLKVNLFIFLVLSLAISLITEKLPEHFYSYKKKIYQVRKWENNGKFYERVFLVKKWKDKLPEFSDFIRTLFSKRHIQSTNNNYLKMFLAESCKAEFTHWAIICSSFLFIFWTDLLGTAKIVVVAVFLNLPYIIIQRYNRPRIIRLLEKFSRDKMEVAPVPTSIGMK